MKTELIKSGVPVGIRLRILVFGLVTLMLTLAGVTFSTVRTESRHVEQLVNYLDPALDANRMALQSLADAQLHKRHYFDTHESSSLSDYKTSVADYNQQIALVGDILKSDPDLSESKSAWSPRVQEERRAGVAWLAISQTQFGQSANGKSVDLLTPQGQAVIASFGVANAGLDTWIAAKHDALRLEAKNAFARQLRLISLVSLLALAIALFAAYRTSRVLTGPLTQLRQTVSRQRIGDREARADEEHGVREVRLLAADFNSLSGENQILNEHQSRQIELHELERRIDRVMRQSGDTDGSLDTLSCLLGEGLNADRVIVQILGSPTQVPNRGQWARPGLAAAPWTLPEQIPRLREFIDHLWITDTQLAFRDLNDAETRADDEAQTFFRETGMQAVLLVPIGLADEAWGLITVGTVKGRRDWTVAESSTVSRSAFSTARLISAATYEANQREHIKRLENLDRQKTDFLSTVSHELRTPLTSISGYLELLEEGAVGDLNAGQRKMVDVIGRNSSRLQGLIEDLLVLNRIESGGLHVANSKVDIARLLEFAVEELRPLADRAGIAFRVNIPEGSVTVDGDSAHLQRAFVNVMSNAIKFSPDGGAIDLTLTEENQSAVMTCEDHGIGIPESERTKMFSRFFRASNAQDKAIPGTGLGLVIVQQIIEDHGGSLDLTSQEGVGTTITLRLPLA